MEFRMNWSGETEKAVVGKARAGDLSAFGLLYDNYSQNVYSRCLRLTKDPDAAEDLRQDVFIQAWKKISGFRGDSRFGTWLHRVTTNMIFMHFRKKKRHPEENQTSRRVKDQWPFEELLSSGPPQLDNRLLLTQAVSTLRPGYRAVLMLHDVDGYKHDEIARILGIPPGTSKSNLYRAHRQIRSRLKRSSQPQVAWSR
jgi:RNA polymerase sigma-70 factor, ECF subfamily